MTGIIFMGTSDFAVKALESLESAHIVPQLIITKADSRFSNRQPLPVKQWALSQGLPLWQPANINSRESIERLKGLKPRLLVVVAYGCILTKEVLAIPALGAVNVHASLLPDLRGAAPVEWALMHGYAETGITSMYMDEGLDTGDIILQEATPIGAGENSGQLRDRLALIAQRLLPETIRLVLQGTAPRRRQPLSCTHHAPALKGADRRLDWERPAEVLVNKIRAFAPKPGAFCLFRQKRLIIYQGAVHPGSAFPGQVALEGKKLLVGAGANLLELVSLKPEGKKTTSAADFINGYRLLERERFY